MFTRISIVVTVLLTVMHPVYNMDYNDLVATGVACPARDKCRGYNNNLDYLKRSCECDSNCKIYQDCCIDIRRRPSEQKALPYNIKCMNYGENLYAGVYVISKCDNTWTGAKEVKDGCEGFTDMSDPVVSTPVINTAISKTYKNLYCAECNNADMEALQFFQYKLACEGLERMSNAELKEKLTYNKMQSAWGVDKVDDEGRSSFVECKIVFDVPSSFNNSVRFCRANVISKCAPNWTRPVVRRQCEEYMAVVFDSERAYRNPHCAQCNHKAKSEISCTSDLFGRKKPFSFDTILNVNQYDNDTPQCPPKHIHDPYLKRCRKLSCALPGFVTQNGRCVRGS